MEYDETLLFSDKMALEVDRLPGGAAFLRKGEISYLNHLIDLGCGDTNQGLRNYFKYQ